MIKTEQAYMRFKTQVLVSGRASCSLGFVLISERNEHHRGRRRDVDPHRYVNLNYNVVHAELERSLFLHILAENAGELPASSPVPTERER